MKKTFNILVLSLVLMSTLASASLFNDGWQRIAKNQQFSKGLDNPNANWDSVPIQNANTCDYEFNSVNKPIMKVWQYRHGERICAIPSGNGRDKSKSGDLNDTENGIIGEGQNNGEQDKSDGTDDNSDDNEGGDSGNDDDSNGEEQETCHEEKINCQWVNEWVCKDKWTGNHWTTQCHNEPHHHQDCEIIEVCE